LAGRLIEPDPVRAARLWHGHCPGAAAPGALTDPAFERVDFARPPAPFEWEFPGNGAVRLDFVATQGGRGLQVSNSGALTLAVAAQRVAAVPGRYVLRVSGDAPGAGLLVSLSCRREFEQAAPVAVRRGGADLDFAGECGAPYLQLWLAPASGPVVLQRVELDRR
jgi:hypothetical protein